MRKDWTRAARFRVPGDRGAGTSGRNYEAYRHRYASASMSAPSDASKGHSSEGHASACPQSEAQDVQKLVPPERGHPIHLVPREAHNRPIIIFVTTCAAKQRQILASASAHKAIVTAW